MAKGSNIVHQYFKKVFPDYTILVRVNPIQFKGTELTIYPDGRLDSRELDFDEHILEDLSHDGFASASALEFNLYYNGLV